MFEQQYFKKVVLTGATGFVGQALVKSILAIQKLDLAIAIRREQLDCPMDSRVKVLPNLAVLPDTNWLPVLHGCDIIIHTAARVHIMKETAADALLEFRKINVAGTLNLAKQAVKAGVKRFIFISSIKVNGESTSRHNPFKPNDDPKPKDAYAISKYEAEQGLLSLASHTKMNVVIIRPPLIYGPGVKGNFQRLIKCIDKGLPLPLGSIKNSRSLVSIDNLVSLIVTCIDNPNAANQIFLVSDGNDLSTPMLLKKISLVLGKPARLIPIPLWILYGLARLAGKLDVIERLCGSLQVDISKTCTLLDWRPKANINEVLALTVKAYYQQCTNKTRNGD